MWTRGRGRAAHLAPAGFGVVLGGSAPRRDWLPRRRLRARPAQTADADVASDAPGNAALLPALARWDAYSRVDVLELDAPRGVQRHVFIDGETPTPMLPAHARPPAPPALAVQDALAALPLRLRTGAARERGAPPTCSPSVPAAGTMSCWRARFGAQRVDAVELNAGVLAVVDAARDFTGDVYRQPGVRGFTPRAGSSRAARRRGQLRSHDAGPRAVAGRQPAGVRAVGELPLHARGVRGLPAGPASGRRGGLPGEQPARAGEARAHGNRRAGGPRPGSAAASPPSRARARCPTTTWS